MKIAIKRERLTDGSCVYDVIVLQGSVELKLPAVTQTDADSLATKIILAIREHSNEEITANLNIA